MESCGSFIHLGQVFQGLPLVWLQLYCFLLFFSSFSLFCVRLADNVWSRSVSSHRPDHHDLLVVVGEVNGGFKIRKKEKSRYWGTKVDLKNLSAHKEMCVYRVKLNEFTPGWFYSQHLPVVLFSAKWNIQSSILMTFWRYVKTNYKEKINLLSFLPSREHHS